ncbi:phage head closure protein [Rhizobium sp. S96]|uniref:phage head closure protein n=1 Tax=Rhizobium sp. S96 TaxID=3055140 RepID=UPI0025AA9804|nr:phage head closure protein [Rhizobium sp. S96]MDM9619083.1 phage head closure protein [Rhizobium sp. S96]
MAEKRSAGKLYFAVAFEERQDLDDGAGNVSSGWVERFQSRAGYIDMRGGEAVIASRLQGQHTLVVFVRASSQSKSVTSDWRIRDNRDGRIFNIRDITITPDRAWIDFLCQSGVAEG